MCEQTLMHVSRPSRRTLHKDCSSQIRQLLLGYKTPGILHLIVKHTLINWDTKVLIFLALKFWVKLNFVVNTQCSILPTWLTRLHVFCCGCAWRGRRMSAGLRVYWYSWTMTDLRSVLHYHWKLHGCARTSISVPNGLFLYTATKLSLSMDT